MVRRALVTVLVLASFFTAPTARAQDGGEEVDAGSFEVPDGSVGTGGADRDNEENEDSAGRVPTLCQESRDCAPGFRCEAQRCSYVGVRDAEGGFGCGGGCSAGPGILGALALAVLACSRRSGVRARWR